MNNPLVPQGSLLEQKNKGRARVKIAVFLVLAIHGVGLFALLMQGCNKAPENTQAANPTPELAPTNPPPTFTESTSPPALDTNPPALANTPPATTTPSAGTSTPQQTAPVTEQPQPPALPGAATPGAATGDYKVAKGDILATIAKKNHVSLKALLDANPGIEPTRLRVGQSIHIPTAGAPAASAGVAATPGAGIGGSAAEPAGAGQVYVVKSGDNLLRIARHHGVSVKALRAANNLRTDRIVVGQKLKLPPGNPAASSPTGTTPAPASATAEPTPLPGGTSAAPGTAPGR